MKLAIPVIPPQLRLALILVACLLLIAAGAVGGWWINGWRKDAEISRLQTAAAEKIAGDAQAALQQYTNSAAEIRAAADRLGLVRRQLGDQITTLKEGLAHAPALPADCRPDAERVRAFHGAIDAANAALAGQRAGGALPADPDPGR